MNSQLLKQSKVCLFFMQDQDRLKQICITLGLKKYRNRKDDSKIQKVHKIKTQTRLINIMILLISFSCFVVKCNERKLQVGLSYVIVK